MSPRALGFSTRPLRLDMDDLGRLTLPCILHWDLNHFVVLARVGRSKATVFDPAFGERTLDFKEFSGHFTGVALELSPGMTSSRGRRSPRFRLAS